MLTSDLTKRKRMRVNATVKKYDSHSMFPDPPRLSNQLIQPFVNDGFHAAPQKRLFGAGKGQRQHRQDARAQYGQYSAEK
jgi:hypothetical protein